MKADALQLERTSVANRSVAILNRLQPLMVGLLVLNALAVVIGLWLGNLYWMFDLLSHFQVQHLCVTLACFAFFVLLQNWRMSALAGCVSVMILYQLAPYCLKQTVPSESSPTLKVVSVNVHIANQQFEKVESFLRQTNADVVSVQEVTPAWAAVLRRLSIYPHSIVVPRTDGFGIAILSKVPFTEQEVFSTGEVPWITATIEHRQQAVQFMAVHTFPPVGARYSAIRNQQLQLITDLVQATTRPVIVAGDLNCTPWSLHFKKLIKDSLLCDTRLANGIQPSWPSRRVLRIPIDHILTSTHFKISSLKVGDETGSDHFPVTCEMTLTSLPIPTFHPK